jgi:hypothetical protein
MNTLSETRKQQYNTADENGNHSCFGDDSLFAASQEFKNAIDNQEQHPAQDQKEPGISGEPAVGEFPKLFEDLIPGLDKRNGFDFSGCLPYLLIFLPASLAPCQMIVHFRGFFRGQFLNPEDPSEALDISDNRSFFHLF